MDQRICGSPADCTDPDGEVNFVHLISAVVIASTVEQRIAGP